MRTFVAFLLAGSLLSAASYPEAEISNSVLRVKLNLPDFASGSYRGTRFDWSGIISSLKFGKHEYFGQWYERHDPKIHDAITGPVEEFLSGDTALGYADAKPGGNFIRIGVGVVRKPEETSFQRFQTYEIVDPGKRSVKTGPDWIEFTHTLSSPEGYGYLYTKRLQLTKGKPELVIHHSLRNTGKRTIETDQYNHNFFVIDNEVVGPDMAIVFPFDPKPAAALQNGAEIQGKEIRYTRPLNKGESVFTEISGFDANQNNYDVRIENRGSGAGVRIQGDQPLSKVVFWSIRTTACPEPYVHIKVDPGQEFSWNLRYTFYELPPSK